MQYLNICNQILTDRNLCKDIQRCPTVNLYCSLAFMIKIITFSIKI
jgi:hypothetical protein